MVADEAGGVGGRRSGMLYRSKRRARGKGPPAPPHGTPPPSASCVPTRPGTPSRPSTPTPSSSPPPTRSAPPTPSSTVESASIHRGGASWPPHSRPTLSPLFFFRRLHLAGLVGDHHDAFAAGDCPTAVLLPIPAAGGGGESLLRQYANAQPRGGDGGGGRHAEKWGGAREGPLPGPAPARPRGDRPPSFPFVSYAGIDAGVRKRVAGALPATPAAGPSGRLAVCEGVALSPFPLVFMSDASWGWGEAEEDLHGCTPR